MTTPLQRQGQSSLACGHGLITFDLHVILLLKYVASFLIPFSIYAAKSLAFLAKIYFLNKPLTVGLIDLHSLTKLLSLKRHFLFSSNTLITKILLDVVIFSLQSRDIIYSLFLLFFGIKISVGFRIFKLNFKQIPHFVFQVLNLWI